MLVNLYVDFPQYFPNNEQSLLHFSCGPHWSSSQLIGRLYNWFLISFGLFIPTLIIALLNAFVIIWLRKVKLFPFYWNLTLNLPFILQSLLFSNLFVLFITLSLFDVNSDIITTVYYF